jgi:hypothetical protein
MTDELHGPFLTSLIGGLKQIKIKHGKDSTPRGNIEIAASQVPTPGISQNFMAPVNDVSPQICSMVHS